MAQEKLPSKALPTRDGGMLKRNLLLRGSRELLKQGHNSHYCNLEAALRSLFSHWFQGSGLQEVLRGKHKPFLAAWKQITQLFTEFL